MSLSYRYELNRVDASDTYFCVNYGVCDTLTITALRSHQSLSPLTLTGFVDRSDAPFSPTKGYIARFELENASAYTGSDYRYNRIFFDGSLYGHKSGTKKVYSAHIAVRLGAARSRRVPTAACSHPRKRFYAGGANSVRGYAENSWARGCSRSSTSTLVRGATSVGGGKCGFRTSTAVKFCDPNSPESVEWRFPAAAARRNDAARGQRRVSRAAAADETFRHFVGAVFIDGGVVGSANIQGLQSIGNIMKGTGAITPGVGIRYMSGVGPIRFDLGLNPNRTESLGVVTAVPDSTGVIRIVPLPLPRTWRRATRFSTASRCTSPSERRTSGGAGRTA